MIHVKEKKKKDSFIIKEDLLW